jgi:hypothetical protein
MAADHGLAGVGLAGSKHIRSHLLKAAIERFGIRESFPVEIAISPSTLSGGVSAFDPHNQREIIMGMFSTSIYYESAAKDTQLFEARFIVRAGTASEARARARASMRDMYAGEVDDSKYVGGITCTVPGASKEKRLSIRTGDEDRTSNQ